MAKKQKQKKKGRKPKNYFCWVIAYIDPQYMEKVTDQLKTYDEFQEVEAYIPTIRLLKKSFKGKNQFEEVPLLFNYGFFKCPRHLAINKNFLDSLRERISCIYAWVKDPMKVMKQKPKIKPDGGPIYSDNEIPVATATSKEISSLIGKTDNYSIHDATDISQLKPGDRVTLRGYPFDNVEAEVVEINAKKEKVKVKIMIFEVVREVMVSFDNVFFTVYHNRNYDDSIILSGAMEETTQSRKVDKKTYKKYKQDEES